MHVGMSINPDYTQFTFWFCYFNPGNCSRGRTMIPADDYREKIIFYSIGNSLADFFIQYCNSFNALGKWRSNWLVQEFVFMRNFFRREMDKKITHKIQCRNLDGIDAKTGATRACTYFRRYFNKLDILHKVSFAEPHQNKIGSWAEGVRMRPY